MPYSGPADTSLPDHVKALPAGLRTLWVGTFNGVFKQNGGDEGAAMAIANAAVKRKQSDETPSRHFFQRIRDSLAELVKADKLSQDDADKVFRTARAYAGGKLHGRKLAFDKFQEQDDEEEEETQRLYKTKVNYRPATDASVCALCRFYEAGECEDNECALVEGFIDENGTCDLWQEKVVDEDLADAAASMFCEECGEYHPGNFRLFERLRFADGKAPETINVLPIPGEYKHQAYGTIRITKERNAAFVDNFNKGVYQDKVPVDAEHETKLSGALGWITKLEQNDDGSVDASIDWEDRGKTAIEEGRFKYFSPEWYDSWTDPMTGDKHKDVLIGGALTTRPFFKEKALRPLVASETGLRSGELKYLSQPDAGDVYVLSPIKARTSPTQKPKEDEPVVDEPELSKLIEDNPAVRKMSEQLVTLEASSAKMTEDLTKANDARVAAEARVATLEAEGRRRRFTDLVSGTGQPDGYRWFGPIDKHVVMLESLSTGFGEDSEQFKSYVEMQQAQAKQLHESKLFTELGTESSTHTSDSPFDTALGAYRKEHPEVSEAEATEKVLAAQPQLYTEYSKGFHKRIRAAAED